MKFFNKSIFFFFWIITPFIKIIIIKKIFSIYSLFCIINLPFFFLKNKKNTAHFYFN